ncbi:MAG: family 20 glycosylhydrolase [Spirochaetales bacterium]|nr:family 20 glycosylhydrolase [Spirochaetales bacterium]
MKKILYYVSLALLFSCASNIVEDEANFRRDSFVDMEYVYRHDLSVVNDFPVPLLPFPKSVALNGQIFKIPAVDGALALRIVDAQGLFNSNFFTKKTGINIVKVDSVQDADLQIVVDGRLASEEYGLDVGPNGIKIVASSYSGVFNGLTTLAQLVIFSKEKSSIIGCVISDAPAFDVRGVMHDTGRNFQSIEYLKEQMENIALYKINIFHFHFTDNPAWRLENKRYPQLNDAKNRRKSRAPEKSYSYDEYIDFAKFCKKLNITVIPEFDMPGHSRYFRPTFGFTMQSRRGMDVLENSLREFAEHVPAELAPYIHLGADEVHILNGEEFIQRMTGVVKDLERIPLVWNPGLLAGEDTILHNWSNASVNMRHKNIDSTDFYTNNSDPLNMVRKIFFKQICSVPSSKGYEFALGGIVCTWNDVAVADEKEVLRNNPFYSSAVAFAETSWGGTPVDRPQFYGYFPESGSAEMEAFAEFEQRFMAHRSKVFAGFGEEFVYTAQSDAKWHLIAQKDFGGFNLQAVSLIKDHPKSRVAFGNSIYLKTIFTKGVFDDLEAGDGVIGLLEFEAERDGELMLIWNTESFARSHRQYGGIAKQGMFDNYGSGFWFNGEAQRPADWAQPGKLKRMVQAWHQPIQEIPWNREEIYWLRKPIPIQVKKGLNQIVVQTFMGFDNQSWLLVALPCEKDGTDILHPTWIKYK